MGCQIHPIGFLQIPLNLLGRRHTALGIDIDEGDVLVAQITDQVVDQRVALHKVRTGLDAQVLPALRNRSRTGNNAQQRGLCILEILAVCKDHRRQHMADGNIASVLIQRKGCGGRRAIRGSLVIDILELQLIVREHIVLCNDIAGRLNCCLILCIELLALAGHRAHDGNLDDLLGPITCCGGSSCRTSGRSSRAAAGRRSSTGGHCSDCCHGTTDG